MSFPQRVAALRRTSRLIVDGARPRTRATSWRLRIAVDAIAGGGVLHTFGSGHSAMVAKEITSRSGGLVPVNQIIDTMDGVGAAQRSGATSTIAGAYLSNLLMLRVVELLIERGVKPPVLMSKNLPDADASNARLLARHRARVRRPGA